MTKFLTYEYVRRELEKRGLFMVSTSYARAKAPIIVRCANGHTWHTTWDIARKNKCAYCVNKAVKLPKDYHELAESIGYKWVGRLPKRTTDKTMWECTSGHRYRSRFLDIKQGKGRCPFCADPKHRYKVFKEHYQSIAKKAGVEWLGPMPRNVNCRTKWRCRKGHIFRTSYKSVSHLGKFGGCIVCSRSRLGVNSPRWRGGRPASKARISHKRHIAFDNTPPEIRFVRRDWKLCKKYFNSRCVYCGTRPRLFPLQKDHFIPMSLGGLHTASNIVPACIGCNSSKRNNLPGDWIPEKFGKAKAKRIMLVISAYFRSVA